MPKSLHSPVYNWVKNVYSLCANSAVNGDFLYTSSTTKAPSTQSVRVQLSIFTHFLASFTPSSYTAFFTQFNLLPIHLYTLSTAPIITKTKEK